MKQSLSTLEQRKIFALGCLASLKGNFLSLYYRMKTRKLSRKKELIKYSNFLAIKFRLQSMAFNIENYKILHLHFQIIYTTHHKAKYKLFLGDSAIVYYCLPLLYTSNILLLILQTSLG